MRGMMGAPRQLQMLLRRGRCVRPPLRLPRHSHSRLGGSAATRLGSTGLPRCRPLPQQRERTPGSLCCRVTPRRQSARLFSGLRGALRVATVRVPLPRLRLLAAAEARPCPRLTARGRS